jgi:hypothetical protein
VVLNTTGGRKPEPNTKGLARPWYCDTKGALSQAFEILWLFEMSAELHVQDAMTMPSDEDLAQ